MAAFWAAIRAACCWLLETAWAAAAAAMGLSPDIIA